MDCRALDDLLLDLPPDLPLDPQAAAAALDLPALPAVAQEHLATCAACRDLVASYARLDRLMVTEPTPPAPPDLVAQVLQAVALRRARDLAWARRQALVLVAAAALVVVGLGLALEGQGAGWSDAATLAGRARADLQAGLDALVAALDAVLARGWSAGERLALPSPPVVLLVALAPALLLLDSLLCRAPHAGRTS